MWRAIDVLETTNWLTKISDISQLIKDGEPRVNTNEALWWRTKFEVKGISTRYVGWYDLSLYYILVSSTDKNSSLDVLL